MPEVDAFQDRLEVKEYMAFARGQPLRRVKSTNKINEDMVNARGQRLPRSTDKSKEIVKSSAFQESNSRRRGNERKISNDKSIQT